MITATTPMKAGTEMAAEICHDVPLDVLSATEETFLLTS